MQPARLVRDKRTQPSRPRARGYAVVAAAALVAFSAGCASLTFPVSGIPARRVPPVLLGESKEDKQTIDLSLLRQKPPQAYRLAAGDVVGVWIDGIFGKPGELAPVHYSDRGDLPPAIGLPFPVREDGTLDLPFVDPIQLDGLTLVEAREAIRRAYTVDKQICKTGRERITITLITPRQYHVLVIRQDSGGSLTAPVPAGKLGSIVIGNTKRGTGHAVNLPAYKNDVLNALADTGGLPGLEAANEIIIQHGDLSIADGAQPSEAAMAECVAGAAGKVVRIPLRVHPGERPNLRPEDVILQNGDIVFIESRDTEVFYTGGLLPTGEFPLPRDYDLDVLEAIAQVQGPIASGGNQTNNFIVASSVVGGGLGGPSPSLVVVLRRTPGGGQIPIRVDLNRALRDPRERILIQPGDIVLLQQTPSEAVARYLSGAVRFFTDWRIWSHSDSSSSATLGFP